ncbi:hypothetical protein DB88DRAFT_540136 [Papiliotrema laurentii]|uniref:Uncharacterized protein n=1 Tax=Papiliotrema laurentii TaxID=5418 RepID=A0AAD9CZ07_PAPLA|nr:hypothetical protein DB88DRAFT_540136 [Papiliotrema laurentii]
MCASLLEEPPFTRPLTPLFSPVGHPAVRVRVSSAIKSSQKRAAPEPTGKPMGVCASPNLTPSGPETVPPANSKIHVIGPFTPQYMEVTDSSTVLRIDNVAWDITPQAVEEYLPPGSLPPDHPQPIHILLNRTDGRTKDYMYIEVVNENAVRRVMKRCQNSYMPGGPLTGGRKRPVTITSVPPHELLNELRPRSAAELNSLLILCHTAVSVPQLAHPTLGIVPPIISMSGAAHYVKSRHGPFYAVMSILSKLQGRTSPAYWDVFFLASGAIKILAQNTSEFSNIERRVTPEECRVKTQDDIVLEKLSSLFHSTFRNFKD